MIDREDLLKIVDFIQESEKIKDVHRSAYTRFGRKESTAEHSWRLALLAMLLMNDFSECDPFKVLSLCLIHDLGELDSGDIPAVEEVDESIKYKIESDTIDRITALLPNKVSECIKSLWNEHEEGNTNEARMVKALDKIETIMQHNIGSNPDDFDYHFNLDYGKHLVDGNDTLESLRAIVDKMTIERINM